MIRFKKYPHVRELIIHYAHSLKENNILAIMNSGIKYEAEATKLAKFIWCMADQMAVGNQNNIVALGRTDNSDIMPDVDYEISSYFSDVGYESIWDKVCDES